ncbi:MAG: VWA domain-containing protein [Acidobacteria bacterium]|nr:VWA domain-containing protein [Acidobacteriota bacterium]
MRPIVFVLCSLLLWAQDEPFTNVQSFQFALVQVPVWVLDKRGRTVDDLKLKHFQVRVDGQEVLPEKFQVSHNRPLELVFLLDLSGSMGLGGKLEASVEAIRYLVKNRKKGDTFRVVVFADQQTLTIVSDRNESELDSLLDKAKAYGKTALFDALSQSPQFFSAGSFGNRAMVLFTDGHDNQSILTEDQVLQVLGLVDVPIFTVGILDGVFPSDQASEEALKIDTLKRISESTGGVYFLAKQATELPTIARLIEQHMRAHYLLAFTVERGPGEREHRIQVTVKQKSFRVRSRKGYIGFLPEKVGGKR